MGLTGGCKKKVSPCKIENSLKFKPVYVCKGKNIQDEKKKKRFGSAYLACKLYGL
jgi:hypothetical protein